MNDFPIPEDPPVTTTVLKVWSIWEGLMAMSDRTFRAACPIKPKTTHE
jgi:hypothetical protein